ncbi:MAG: hypothetical protein ACOYBW_08640 [Fluviibacter phosphoraccumulans]
MTESVDRQEVRITKLGHPVDIVYKALPFDTHAERVYAELPLDMCTDGGTGEYRRLRVDVGQTSFFAGREFFTFYDFSIPASGTIVIRAIAYVDVVLQEFGFELDTAKVQMSLYAGGTGVGAFDVSLPILKTNTMSTASAYVSQVVMDDNGTGHTGGTLVNIFRGDASNKGAQQNINSDNPFGFPAGTYFIVLQNLVNNDTAKGIFKARWEERP